MKILAGITYIVTVFNKESFIKSTLLSIIPYLGRNRQLLVINDGSTDKSLQIINRVLRNEDIKDSKVITQKNTGPSLAINKSLKYVKYSHIKFVDGDDILAPNIANLMKKEMEWNNLDILYGDWVWDENPGDYKFSKEFIKSNLQKNIFEKIIKKGWGGSSNLMVKTKALIQVGGCDPQIFVQDYSIPLRITGHHFKSKGIKPFMMGVTKTIICCGPKYINNRIMGNDAQTLHDMSMATINFINTHKLLPFSYKKHAHNRIIDRCKKWERRKSRNRVSISYIFQSFLRLIPTKTNEKNISNLVAISFRNDSSVRKIQFIEARKLKILVYVGLDLLGDALLKIPFLRLLRTYFPNSDIHWYAGKGKSVFKSSLKQFSKKLIDKIADDQEFGSRIRELFVKPRVSEKYDIVLDTQKRLLTTLILRKIDTNIFISQTSNFLFSNLKPIKKINKNLSLQLLNLVELLGNNSGNQVDPNLVFTAKSQDTKKYFNHIGRACIAICPGASTKEKCWPLENYIKIAKYIYEKEMQPLFVLGPNEENLYSLLKKKTSYAKFPLQEINYKNSSPENTILLARNCLLGISNDTGCGHLLAASNIPMLILYGPTSAEKFSPYTEGKSCFIESIKFGEKNIEKIPIEEVKKAIKKMLRI